MRASLKGRHISGAEGIYPNEDIKKAADQYLRRALEHPKGVPDEVVITVDALKEKPIKITALPISTLRCRSHKEAKRYVMDILCAHGISDSAIDTALEVLSGKTLRGASIVEPSGIRLEPDRDRGVRVSRIGIERDTEGALLRGLKKFKISTTTVKEAVILASKVALLDEIIAELCVSDDPDYTTGYIASKKIGYLRIPYIKRYGSKKGGRVFFVKENLDIKKAIDFLEKKPAIVSSLGNIKGDISIDEIISGCRI